MNAELFGVIRDWEALISIIESNDSFVFSTHLQPDADGLGSELGLARYLSGIGKTVRILNPSPLRVNLEFLPQPGEVEVFDPEEHSQLIEDSDVFIDFEIGHYNRLNELCPVLEQNDILKISIDHHPGDKSQFDKCFDFPTASSTGVLMYDLLKNMSPESLNNYDIAKPLYAAIMSDTGNFRFNNTDPETFRAAGQLVAAGVKPNELYVHIYEDLNTPGRLMVIQKLLKELQYDYDGRLAWSTIDFEEVSAEGATPDDLHSLSDFIRSIKGVEVGISITKMPGQATDISFRSKGKIPINTIAMEFGGGGHAFAAGCRVDNDLEKSADLIVEAARKAIRDWDANA